VIGEEPRVAGLPNMTQGIPRRRVVSRAVAAILFVAVFAIGCSRSREASSAAPKAPDQGRKAVKVTFIELGSVNCIPCKAMQPIMREIEATFPRDVQVVFHDVWTEKGAPFADQFKVRVIPTQVFLDEDGTEFFRHEGFFAREDLVALLKARGVER
jgi:thioredoxin 1